ncbi:hypothetical protein D3C86_2133840 [compost metagenome]
MKVFADRLPCNLDGQVSKKAKPAAAPPLQVILVGEAYWLINSKRMQDEAGFLD